MNITIDKLLKLTHRLEFFDTMSEHERLEVLERLNANVSSHPKGATIISQQTKDHYIYIILSGLVTVQKGEPMNAALSVIEPGDFFGEVSFMTQTSAGVDVVANQDTIVLRMNNEEFGLLNGLIRDKIKNKIIFKLVQRLRHMNILAKKNNWSQS